MSGKEIVRLRYKPRAQRSKEQESQVQSPPPTATTEEDDDFTTKPPTPKATTKTRPQTPKATPKTMANIIATNSTMKTTQHRTKFGYKKRD